MIPYQLMGHALTDASANLPDDQDATLGVYFPASFLPWNDVSPEDQFKVTDRYATFADVIVGKDGHPVLTQFREGVEFRIINPVPGLMEQLALCHMQRVAMAFTPVPEHHSTGVIAISSPEIHLVMGEKNPRPTVTVGLNEPVTIEGIVTHVQLTLPRRLEIMAPERRYWIRLPQETMAGDLPAVGTLIRTAAFMQDARLYGSAQLWRPIEDTNGVREWFTAARTRVASLLTQLEVCAAKGAWRAFRALSMHVRALHLTFDESGQLDQLHGPVPRQLRPLPMLPTRYEASKFREHCGVALPALTVAEAIARRVGAMSWPQLDAGAEELLAMICGGTSVLHRRHVKVVLMEVAAVHCRRIALADDPWLTDQSVWREVKKLLERYVGDDPVDTE